MDRRLLERHMLELADGEIAALDGIYALTSRGVYLLSYSILRSPERAADVMQNTFVRVAANISKYNKGTNALAWISRIARNLSYREYTDGNRTVSADAAVEELSDGGGKEAQWTDNLLLSAAMNGLSREEREIVTLFAVEGYRHREIAEILEKPVGTVQWLYNRALKRLRKILEEKGVYEK